MMEVLVLAFFTCVRLACSSSDCFRAAALGWPLLPWALLA